MDPNQQATQSAQPQPTPEDQLAATNQALIKKKQLADKQMNESYSAANISQAMSKIAPNSTAGKVGQAISSDTSWANLCEAYAEKSIYGKTGIFPTAIAAFQANAQNGNISTSTKDIPKGSQIFWSADQSNGQNGHTMVANGNSTYRSPLSDGSIKDFTLQDWAKYSGQKYLGYAPPPAKQ